MSCHYNIQEIIKVDKLVQYVKERKNSDYYAIGALSVVFENGLY